MTHEEQIATEPVVVTAPASVNFLKSLWEQVGPGHLAWDFSRSNQVIAPGDRSMEVKAGVLKTLKLKEAGLAGELKIDGAGELDWLTLQGNRLTAVEFKNLPKLVGFQIIDEHLTTLTFGGGLGRLYGEAVVVAANLARLVVKGRNRLTELYIRASRLEDISPLRRLKNLLALTIKSELLSDLSPLEGLSFSFVLGLDSPLVSDLKPLGKLKYVSELRLISDKITDLRPLVKLKDRLYALDVNSNSLTDLAPLAQLKKLGVLGLVGDALTDLSPLAGLTSLWDLVLEGKNLTDLSPLAKVEDGLSWYLVNNCQLKGEPCKTNSEKT